MRHERKTLNYEDAPVSHTGLSWQDPLISVFFLKRSFHRGLYTQ